MSVSVDRLCLKDVNEEIKDVKQILFDIELVKPEIPDKKL